MLSGDTLKQVATGLNAVQATTADGGRVAVLRADGSVALYSAAGKPLLTVDTPPNTEAVALRGTSLLVGTKTRQLELYDAHTGSLRKTFNERGTLDLTTGKDRPVVERHGGVALAHIDSAGVAYVDNGFGVNYGKATLVFLPLAKVAATLR